MRGPVTAALVALSCAHPPRVPVPVDGTLPVTALAVEFPAPDVGQLSFSLPAPSAPVERVTWELFLDGARFAVGVEGALAPTPAGGLEVRVPLAWRHLGWREGAAPLEVALQGTLETRGPRRRYGFRAKRDALVQGRPMLAEPAGAAPITP